MKASLRWTSADLDSLPDDGKRYEIIDGELYVSKQPQWHHQLLSALLFSVLQQWSTETGTGQANVAPGLIFDDDDDVAPDVVWIQESRLAAALDTKGHLHAAPDLVIEVLSPGLTNERRDREAKLKLYSQRGVREYWIVSWQRREIEVYRRQELALALFGTLHETDVLESPLLPGFHCSLSTLFAALPTG